MPVVNITWFTCPKPFGPKLSDPNSTDVWDARCDEGDTLHDSLPTSFTVVDISGNSPETVRMPTLIEKAQQLASEDFDSIPIM